MHLKHKRKHAFVRLCFGTGHYSRQHTTVCSNAVVEQVIVVNMYSTEFKEIEKLTATERQAYQIVSEYFVVFKNVKHSL